MPRYTAKNDAGRKVTFEWDGQDAPTDADMEEIFAASSSPTGKTGYVPPLSPEQQAANVTKAQQEAVKSLPWGERFAGGVGKGLMDTYAGVGQLATKATDALGITEGASDRITKSYGAERDLYNKATQGDVASRVGEVGGNLALGALVPMGGAAGVAAKGGVKLGGTLGKVMASRVGSMAAGGALEGAAMGGTQFAGEGDSRTQNAMLGGALGGALPLAGKATVETAKVAGKWGNKLLGKAAEEFSGVSEEALRTYGTGLGDGAKKIREAAGTQHDIGQKLVNMLDKLDDYLPEKEIVDKALNEMPPVNVTKTLETLEGAKSGGVLKSSRDVNEKIAGLVDDLRAATDEAGNIPAQAYREIRKELDVLAGDAFGKESNKFISAVKQARHQMADDLVKTAEASGNPEYIDAMQSMAKKLQTADNLKSFLGKSAQTREQRAESFVSTLFGKNKEERQKAVQAMGEIFGQDFIEQSKLAHLAAELGEGGKPSLLPRQFTGRSALGPVFSGGLIAAGGGPLSAIPTALSSPRLSSLALGATDAAGRNIAETGKRLKPIGLRALQLGARAGTYQGARE